jgi:hypothetical protein
MINRRPVFVVLAMVLLTPSVSAQSAQQITFEEFDRLPAAHQAAVYATVSPEEKAQLLRARFQRWLDENSAALSARQQSAVREVIETVSAELFRNPQDPASVQRQVTTSEKVYCALGSELAFAFAKDQRAGPVERTWTQAVHQWVDWTMECVIK